MLDYVAICMGEGSGSAAEIILKTVAAKPLNSSFGIIVTGDAGIFRRTSEDLGIPLPFSAYACSESELREAENRGEQYIFYCSSEVPMDGFEYGRPTAETGIASYGSVKAAVDIICNGYASTLVTTAVSSIALGLAGYSENSISDLLSSFAESRRLTNMFLYEKANIFLTSYHGSVRAALDAVREENLMDAVVWIDSIFVSGFFDTSKPIALSAVNPDIGDGEWFGPEEKSVIEPVVERCRLLGINVVGPVPVPDIYRRAERGEYSAAIVYFRNEVITAAKDRNAVKITWGLPFLSVGTTSGLGFETAGKGIADTGNMLKAIEIAMELSDKHYFA